MLRKFRTDAKTESIFRKHLLKLIDLNKIVEFHNDNELSKQSINEKGIINVSLFIVRHPGGSHLYALIAE